MTPLAHLKNFSGSEGPLLCIVLDGFGIGKHDKGDCVHIAQPTNINRLIKEAQEQNLYCELKAHGTAVGLPDDTDMGNSEVGHNALGAGQLIDQGSKLVGNVIADGSLFTSDNFKFIVNKATTRHATVHLLGLLSDGNVHSHIDHLIAIVTGLSRADCPKVRIHMVTDGRDVGSMSALTYVDKLEKALACLGRDYKIASGGGRMYVTMDRYEADWQIVRRGWDAMVLGETSEANGWLGKFQSTKEAIEAARLQFPKKTDQDYPPWVVVDPSGAPLGKISDGDVVINFNFRGDRAIEISRAFEDGPDFDEKYFARRKIPKIDYFGLLIYDSDKNIPRRALCPNPDIKNVLSKYLCEAGVTQYAVSETHKFGHVTYFWNGNRSGYVNEKFERYEEVRKVEISRLTFF
jgi:2,3-bisphosphoglycerate-independent phosphoglycerate mutase